MKVLDDYLKEEYMELRKRSENKIDILSIARDIARQWWVILLFSISAYLAAVVVMTVRYEPVYTTTTTFAVSTRGTNVSFFADMTSAKETADKLQLVLDSEILKRKVVEDLDLDSFGATARVSVVPETSMLTLTVQDKTAFQAYRVMKSILANYASVSEFIVQDIVLNVIQPPSIPSYPSNSTGARRMGGLAALAAAGLLAGYIAVFSYMKDTVKSTREAQKKIASTYLGAIYHEGNARSRKNKNKKISMCITNPLLSFVYVESSRKAASRVRSRLDKKGHKILLVTSVAENEGKTTVASNIALAIAQEGKRVLLVDCDFRRPALYKVFDVPREEVQDLPHLIYTEGDKSSIITKLKTENLYFILNQRPTSNIEDIVKSGKFASIIEFVRDKFDYIILDTPPLGMVPDAEEFANFADSTLIIVRQDLALAPNINDAIDTMNKTAAPLLGFIYNDAHGGLPGSGNQYGYGYGGYGFYYRYAAYEKRKGMSETGSVGS